MKSKYPRIIIAGLKGGSGKTTLSLGLIAAFRKKGMKVIPFTKGRNYSRNLQSCWHDSAEYGNNALLHINGYSCRKKNANQGYKRLCQ
ncbi:nucleotide-binding protein [Candidatus Hakubella thermalkaliphila]|uniref:nucleotide-binding protein n=1 Tax=Candidatus Hakubella thermalkaliphila TaxID=2754717 RepID=UPI0015940EC4